MVISLDKYYQLTKTLPPLVAVLVWDVLNDHITEATVELAQTAAQEEYDQYDLIRCIVAANPNYPPLELAKGLVDEMLEAIEVAT